MFIMTTFSNEKLFQMIMISAKCISNSYGKNNSIKGLQLEFDFNTKMLHHIKPISYYSLTQS